MKILFINWYFDEKIEFEMYLIFYKEKKYENIFLTSQNISLERIFLNGH